MMVKFKRSKNKIWGTGAQVPFSTVKMLDEETTRRINHGVYLQSCGTPVQRPTELKGWQKQIMGIN